MRYIDRRFCSRHEKGYDHEVETLGELTREATRIAEQNGLAVMRTSYGAFRIIKRCGLGAYSDTLETLAEVDDFLKHLDRHAATKY